MVLGSASGEPLQVIGRYALFGALAAGGMATVHLGRLLGPVGFSRTVAIKRLHEQYAADPEFVSSFLDEARLAARIRHPNVVPTLDVVATNGQLFLVMEYVQGESLSRLLKRLRARDAVVPMRTAVAIVSGVLHGLHAAHEARNEKGEPLQIVHRDVSPHNILVGIDGVPRVVDFGVAKAAGRLTSTTSGRVKGKIAYMSPEQLRGQPVDRRTDVFAASVVLWESLTGKRLFHGENEGAVLERVLFLPIEPPSTHVANISPELDRIVMRGLERDKEKRWQTAREMALALEDHVPLPTAAQIGTWVDSTAHDTLAERATLVAEMESATSDAGERVSQLLNEVQSSRSDETRQLPLSGRNREIETATRSAAISMSASAAPPEPESRLRWAIPIGLLALLIVGVAISLALIGTKRGAVSAASNAEKTAAAPPPATSLAPLGTVETESKTVEPSATPETAPSAAPEKAPTSQKPRAQPKPKPAGVDCSVPFTRDELGRKIWKKECLNE